MKVVFMGTPDYAVAALEAIVASEHQVVAAVTQPDKPKGRSGKMQMTPVKECALKYDIPVFQPVKVKAQEAVEMLQSYEADVFVVAAFGQILSEEILQMPKYGCVNIHASLLPKYRGAAPIQWAIINGEQESGITIMQMDQGIDTGDILMQSVVPIDRKETGESLYHKLAKEGARMIVEALRRIEAGDITPEKQNEAESSYVKILQKSMGEIAWDKDAVQIERLVRGMNSWPSAYTTYHGKTLKIWDSSVCEDEEAGDGSLENALPGTIIAVGKDAFYVQTGDKALKITEIQLEGKKRMAVKDFLLGAKICIGERLG